MRGREGKNKKIVLVFSPYKQRMSSRTNKHTRQAHKTITQQSQHKTSTQAHNKNRQRQQ